MIWFIIIDGYRLKLVKEKGTWVKFRKNYCKFFYVFFSGVVWGCNLFF